MENWMKKPLGYAVTCGQDGFSGACDFAVANQFNCVELSMNLPEFFPEHLPAGEVRQYADQYGLMVSAHAPEDISLIHLHESLREAGIQRLQGIMKWAGEAGLTRLTMHIGNSVYFTLPQGRQYLHDVYPDRFRRLLSDSLVRLRDAAPRGLYLCVENVSYFGRSVVQEVLEELLPAGGLFLTWDLGHSYGDPIQEPFMRQHAAYVRNCHVHDHNGKTDHLVVGDGLIDFSGYLKEVAGQDIHLIFEVRPRENAVISRDRFLDLQKS
jgi:sugar phosphate isomerase/epimerase